MFLFNDHKKACALKYKKRYKQDPGDSDLLYNFDFALVASVGVDILKAAPRTQRWATVEHFLADVMKTVADQLKERAADGGSEGDELVTEVVNFYGACMDERRRVDKDQLLAVLSEWASLLPLSTRDKEITQGYSKSDPPWIDQLDESALDAYRSALSSFPDLFKSTPHVSKHIWLALKLKMQEEKSDQEELTLADFQTMTLKYGTSS
ncbi:hypothetical protein KFL_001330200 [Klebsormidium nitens]|uniref:Uncharacterized protein n=1 Tax=Klebsormidium nitens TaxID=105231 RepID=A0A0U9HMA1_KLENI|nr:hypothetical protein KFL_001330200 [Klebsormidium nitens]|eukprot:GAQ83037.1 hypothetical protein KFL_001330200 [Klebsormidium nitens]